MVIYKLYTRIEISNTELSKLPSLNGFWNNDLETSSRFKREIIDGIAYNVATIKKTVLTAQKTGELIIDPMEVKCSIRIQNQQNRRDPFANFFGNYNTKEEFIKSKPIIIQVKELPVPKPMDFDGLVGDMNIQTSINTNTVAANDAINYTIKLIGTGNIELAKPFDMKFPSDFEVYDPKISEKIFEGGRKRSIKTFEYVLIPRFQGLYNIPETTISTFNPITKNYRTIKSKSFEIEVTKGRIDNNNNDENINQQVVSQVNTDIKYINMSTEFTETKTIRKQLNRFYLLFFLPFTLLFIILITYYFIGKKDFESKKWKNKKANNIAQKRLKNAKKCINNADFDRFFEEIEKSLWGYFADKFEVEAALLSKETIHQYFKKSLISTEIEAQFINLISSCEYARYAPSSNKNEQMNKTLNMAKQIIIKVESAIK